MLKEHLVRASLNRSIPHLPASAHDSIVGQMKTDGLVGDGAEIRAGADPRRIESIACAVSDPTRYRLAKQAIGMLNAMGAGDIDLEKPIDPVDLDQRLRRRDNPTVDRIAIKDLLYKLNCLPA